MCIFSNLKKILIAYNNGQNFCVLRSEREQKYENKIAAEIIEYTDIRATYPSSNFLETQKKQMIIFFLKKNQLETNFYFSILNCVFKDMNEPANFGTNEEKPWNYPPNEPTWSLHCPDSPLEDPPYRTSKLLPL